MAYICKKPEGSCYNCEHFRYDADKGCNVCFAATDTAKAFVLETFANNLVRLWGSDRFEKAFNATLDKCRDDEERDLCKYIYGKFNALTDEDGITPDLDALFSTAKELMSFCKNEAGIYIRVLASVLPETSNEVFSLALIPPKVDMQGFYRDGKWTVALEDCCEAYLSYEADSKFVFTNFDGQCRTLGNPIATYAQYIPDNMYCHNDYGDLCELLTDIWAPTGEFYAEFYRVHILVRALFTAKPTTYTNISLKVPYAELGSGWYISMSKYEQISDISEYLNQCASNQQVLDRQSQLLKLFAEHLHLLKGDNRFNRAFEATMRECKSSDDLEFCEHLYTKFIKTTLVAGTEASLDELLSSLTDFFCTYAKEDPTYVYYKLLSVVNAGIDYPSAFRIAFVPQFITPFPWTITGYRLNKYVFDAHLLYASDDNGAYMFYTEVKEATTKNYVWGGLGYFDTKLMLSELRDWVKYIISEHPAAINEKVYVNVNNMHSAITMEVLMKTLNMQNDTNEYAVEVYNSDKFVRQIDVYSTEVEAKQAIEHMVRTDAEHLDSDESFVITTIEYDADGNEIGTSTEEYMPNKRKLELLYQMKDYLGNLSSFDFSCIDVDDDTAYDIAYDNCLGYLAELKGHASDREFYENLLGFTKEELIGEGMEWLYPDDNTDIKGEIDMSIEKSEANRLFAELMSAIHFSVEYCTAVDGYVLYDNETNTYRGGEDLASLKDVTEEDVDDGAIAVCTTAAGIVEELDSHIYDSFHSDIADELRSYGLVTNADTVPETLSGLYDYVIALVENKAATRGLEFYQTHKTELQIVNLICNYIDVVDLNELYPKSSASTSNPDSLLWAKAQVKAREEFEYEEPGESWDELDKYERQDRVHAWYDKFEKLTKLQRRFTAQCRKTYIEDAEEVWTKGRAYEVSSYTDGTYEIKTNQGTIGAIGPAYMLNDFSEYFIGVVSDRPIANQIFTYLQAETFRTAVNRTSNKALQTFLFGMSVSADRFLDSTYPNSKAIEDKLSTAVNTPLKAKSFYSAMYSDFKKFAASLEKMQPDSFMAMAKRKIGEADNLFDCYWNHMDLGRIINSEKGGN